MNADMSERWWSDHIAHGTRIEQDQLERLTPEGLHISQLPLVYTQKHISETSPNNSNNWFLWRTTVLSLRYSVPHLKRSLIIKLIDATHLGSNPSHFVLGAGTEH